MVLTWMRLAGFCKMRIRQILQLEQRISRENFWWYSLWKFGVSFFYRIYVTPPLPAHTLEEMKTLSLTIQASRKLSLTGLHQTGGWWWMVVPLSMVNIAKLQCNIVFAFWYNILFWQTNVFQVVVCVTFRTLCTIISKTQRQYFEKRSSGEV